MSEFVNVTEVEKLPLNKVDSLVAIDSNNNIKRTAVTVDQDVIPESTNPVSSKGVYDIIVVLGNDFGEAVTDLENQIGGLGGDITDIREEIAVLNEECATKDWVNKEVKAAIEGGVDLSNYYTKSEVDTKIAEIPTPDFTGYATESWVDAKGYLTEIPSEYVTDAELTNKGYATESYVIGLVGDINTVLDQINGEVV